MNDLACWFLTIVAILVACSMAVFVLTEWRYYERTHR